VSGRSRCVNGAGRPAADRFDGAAHASRAGRPAHAYGRSDGTRPSRGGRPQDSSAPPHVPHESGRATGPPGRVTPSHPVHDEPSPPHTPHASAGGRTAKGCGLSAARSGRAGDAK
jgi:hypothetical protein